MNEETGDPPVVPSMEQDEAPDMTVRESFARLLSDGRAYVEAEADRQKVRAGLLGAGIRDAAILAAIAIMLLFAALVALLVGLIIALSPALTPLGATGAVLGVTMLIALLLLLLAKARISKMKKATRG